MKKLFSLAFIALIALAWAFQNQDYSVDENRFITHKIDPQEGHLSMFWKNDNGEIFGSIKKLKNSVSESGQELIFAMNGGMYLKDQSPQGLYVEEGEILSPLNTEKSNYGNFYLQPNGVFYLTKQNEAGITTTKNFMLKDNIKYATQSGPMLLIDGKYHPKLTKGSTNLHIRNGVGILPNGKLIFAMSKEQVNFYDMATLFRQNGCQHALYLDGFVSRTFLPSANWEQLDGAFGVIIGEVK